MVQAAKFDHHLGPSSDLDDFLAILVFLVGSFRKKHFFLPRKLPFIFLSVMLFANWDCPAPENKTVMVALSKNYSLLLLSHSATNNKRKVEELSLTTLDTESGVLISLQSVRAKAGTGLNFTTGSCSVQMSIVPGRTLSRHSQNSRELLWAFRPASRSF